MTELKEVGPMRAPLMLSLDSDTFSAFKADFKRMMQDTIMTMQEKGVGTASMTVKFDIALTDSFDGDLGEAVTVPVFDHKITASIQLKSETKGSLGGAGYKLQWDNGLAAFVMVPIEDCQASLFDDGYDYEAKDVLGEDLV